MPDLDIQQPYGVVNFLPGKSGSYFSGCITSLKVRELSPLLSHSVNIYYTEEYDYKLLNLS